MKHDNEKKIDAMDKVNGYRPALTMFKPNAKGTGAAIRFTLTPATEYNDGYIMVEMANQDGFAGEEGYSTFDWDHSIGVYLTIDIVAKMIQVFDGETESINGIQGIDIYRDGAIYCRLCVRHIIAPQMGYVITIHTDINYSIDLSPSEALGLMLALEGSLTTMAFGRPKLSVK